MQPLYTKWAGPETQCTRVCMRARTVHTMMQFVVSCTRTCIYGYPCCWPEASLSSVKKVAQNCLLQATITKKLHKTAYWRQPSQFSKLHKLPTGGNHHSSQVPKIAQQSLLFSWSGVAFCLRFQVSSKTLTTIGKSRLAQRPKLFPKILQ